MNRTKFDPNAVQCVMKFNIGNGLFTAQTDGGEVLWGRQVSTDGWGGMPKFRPIHFFGVPPSAPSWRDCYCMNFSKNFIHSGYVKFRRKPKKIGAVGLVYSSGDTVTKPVTFWLPIREISDLMCLKRHKSVSFWVVGGTINRLQVLTGWFIGPILSAWWGY